MSDLEQTLLPRGDAPRQVAWDEVTDPSLISAPVVPLASTSRARRPSRASPSTAARPNPMRSVPHFGISATSD